MHVVVKEREDHRNPKMGQWWHLNKELFGNLNNRYQQIKKELQYFIGKQKMKLKTQMSKGDFQKHQLSLYLVLSSIFKDDSLNNARYVCTVGLT